MLEKRYSTESSRERERERVEQSFFFFFQAVYNCFQVSSQSRRFQYPNKKRGVGRRTTGQLLRILEMFSTSPAIFSWIPGKQLPSRISNLGALFLKSMQRSAKSTAEIGGEIESCDYACLNAKRTVSLGRNLEWPLPLASHRWVWPAKCKWKEPCKRNRRSQSIYWSDIGYIFISILKKASLAATVCSPTKVLQAAAAAVPRHTTFGLHGAYCHTVDIYGPANLYCICTVQESI